MSVYLYSETSRKRNKLNRPNHIRLKTFDFWLQKLFHMEIIIAMQEKELSV